MRIKISYKREGERRWDNFCDISCLPVRQTGFGVFVAEIHKTSKHDSFETLFLGFLKFV